MMVSRLTIQKVLPNLDSWMERADNPLADAVQNYHHNSKSRWLCWKTLGRIIPPQFLI